MRVFVTGATGLIGRALVQRLGQRGDRVVAFVRDAGRARRVLGPGVEPLEVGVAGAGLAASLASVDAVVNLAGEPLADGRWTPARKQALVDSRVAVTRRLVEALAAAPTRPAVLVSGSAVGYYGDGGDGVLPEGAGPGDDFAARLCVDWEAAAEAAGALGVRVVKVRTGVVLARDGGALARLVPAFRWGVGGPLGTGRQWVPWIHLHDEVEALVACLDRPGLSGAVNAVAPTPVTSRELAAALGRALHRPAALPVPAFALRLGLGELSSLLLGGQRAVPAALQACGFTFRFGTLDAALADLLTAGPGAPA